MTSHAKARPSRERERARALDLAAGVLVPASCDVVVVGGGAAGLAAAVAARDAGASVVVLEADPTCGRTILATGNGRCNFANEHLDAYVYNQPEFVAAAWGDRPLDAVLGLFSRAGLEWVSEDGRLYPRSRVAASVRDVLVELAQECGAVLAPGRRVNGLAHKRTSWLVGYAEQFDGSSERTIVARSVVIATGGRATEALAPLGLPLSPARPVLCPIACDPTPAPALDGRRVWALATVLRDGVPVFSEAGEVLFRGYGLSGIVMFDLSRHVCPGDRVVLDLVPERGEGELKALLRDRPRALAGIIDPTVAHVLAAGVGGCAPEEVAHLAKRLTFCVTGPADVEHAQVTRGGLSTRAFEPETLEARDLPGLHACGEALDVDGPCGGYNLGWAWSSGLVAGAAAARGACGREDAAC